MVNKTSALKRSTAKKVSKTNTVSSDWRSVRRKHIVSLFKKMAREVPAYKNFLKEAGVRSEKIKTVADISLIPKMNKDNYLRANPYADLFWGGSLITPHVMTATSGSTGEPFYFARSRAIDEQSALIHERFFVQSSLSKTRPTLVVVCFGMGVWIGGLITYQAFQLLGKRGHPISVITPGINKSEIFKILKLLAPNYDQLILVGYPPFIKDLFDEAQELGISLDRYQIGVVFAAEAFSEHFRDYVAGKARIKNILTDTMNIYGSADIGTMAAETPLSILIRRLATGNNDLFMQLFGNIQKTPTLAQFYPTFTSFESEEGDLLVSGDSAMPLVRYAIGDNGGVLSYAEIETIMHNHGIDLKREIKQAGIEMSLTNLPFVYVYERSDLSTTLYGLQIYPETIKETLLAEQFTPFVTGRFTLVTKFDDRQDQYLEINVEMRRDKEPSKALSAQIAAEAIKNLKFKNGEFKELYNFLGARAEPRLVFWPHEDPLYFRRDIKQKWVVRTEQA